MNISPHNRAIIRIIDINVSIPIQYDLYLLQSLCDLAIEVACPVHAICRLSDDRVQENAAALSHLESGDALRETFVAELYAGSRAEGLALEHGCGHPQVDFDIMRILGGQLSVSLPCSKEFKSHQSSARASPLVVSTPSLQGPFHTLSGNSCLEYAPESCPPAYTRLRVTDLLALKKHLWVGEQGMEQSDGHYWLLPMELNETLQRYWNMGCDPDDKTTCIGGPAGQRRGGLIDYVPCFVANGPHPAIADYLRRVRTGWPSQEQLIKLWKVPMCTVMLGHKTSPNQHQLARMSWSPGELRLISQLPSRIKQGYIAAKYTLKSFLKRHKKPDDGRSHVGSFHLKNTLLNYLEQTPPSEIDSPSGLMLELLHKLLSYVNDGQLPLYFLPQCNLLETVGMQELKIARRAIQDIIADPVAAVIYCPSVPREIYGNVSQSSLLHTLRHASADPTSMQKRDDLSELLCRVDKWRQQQYHKQLRLDNKDPQVSGRPELRGLVEMLRQIE